MKILLTNDDGLSCEGIWALKRVFEAASHDVYMVVPEENRSGISHGITMRGPIRLRQKEAQVWACSGTPADCIIVSLLGDLAITPDLIVSGINEGPNLGTDIIYSGTASAARQGAIHGLPSLAVSMGAYTKPFHYDMAAHYITDRLEDLLCLWEPDTFLNINIPNTPITPTDYRLTWPSRRSYNDQVVRFHAPDGHHYCFLEGGAIETREENGSDWHAVEQGFVSISKIYIHPVVIEDLRPSR
ncbi:MAG: 5'/3'-nucleotidase SurE [Termitinemataceae bacterium]